MTHYIHDFERDEKLYKVGLITDGAVNISMRRRNQFPSEIISTHFNRALNFNHIHNFDCFYTGMQCWVGRGTDERVLDEKMRFMLTKEHLASIKTANVLGLSHKVHQPFNLIGVASYFNYKVGHIPLGLKLWIKKNLAQLDYSREELSFENSHIILAHIIALQDQFLYEGFYPWQLSTYKNNSHRKFSEAIFKEMTEIDREFLNIDNIKESYQWLEQYDPAWIEKFIA